MMMDLTFNTKPGPEAMKQSSMTARLMKSFKKTTTIPDDFTRYRFQAGIGEVFEQVLTAFVNHSAFLRFLTLDFISKFKLISQICGPGMYLNSSHYKTKNFFYTMDNYL